MFFSLFLCQDYDRDPDVLRMLGVKVWVLSSSLQIMPLKEQGEDELLRKLKDIITATRHVVQPWVADDLVISAGHILKQKQFSIGPVNSV